MNAPLDRDGGGGDAGGPVQLAVVGVDVAVGAAHQLPVDVALPLTDALRLAPLVQGALVTLHAVVGQAWI